MNSDRREKPISPVFSGLSILAAGYFIGRVLGGNPLAYGIGGAVVGMLGGTFLYLFLVESVFGGVGSLERPPDDGGPSAGKKLAVFLMALSAAATWAGLWLSGR